MTDAVAIVDHRGRELEPVKVDGAPNPAALIQLAVEKGAAVDQLERLLALQERWEANEARKAYVRAMAEFKRDPPEIWKSKRARVTSKRTGGTYEYDYADLGEISRTITAALSRHGFTINWKTRQSDQRVEVECICTHEQGHHESSVFQGPPWALVGGNAVQEVAAAITFAKRYTLLDVTGLHPLGLDDDSNSSPSPRNNEGRERREEPQQNNSQRKAIHAATVEQREEIGRLQDLASDSGLAAVADYLGKALASKLTQPRAAELIKRAQDKIAEATAESEQDSGECQHANVNDAGRCMDCGQGVPGCSL